MVEATQESLRNAANLALSQMPESPTQGDVSNALAFANIETLATELDLDNALPAEEPWGTPLHPGFAVTGNDGC